MSSVKNTQDHSLDSCYWWTLRGKFYRKNIWKLYSCVSVFLLHYFAFIQVGMNTKVWVWQVEWWCL